MAGNYSFRRNGNTQLSRRYYKSVVKEYLALYLVDYNCFLAFIKTPSKQAII